MKLKKLTSIICSTAMALSIISMPAAANTETAEKYLLINDQFASGDVGGWVQHKHSDASYGLLTTTDIGDGNYALLYETTSENWSKDFIKRPMPGGNIPLSSDVNIVIETKIKIESQGYDGNGNPNDTRMFLKYNLNDNAVEKMNIPEYNLMWGTLFAIDTGNLSLFNGNYYSSSNNYYSYPYGFGGVSGKDGNSNVVTSATDKWYTYKLVLHGGTPRANHTATGNTVDFYIYDENGTKIVEKTGFDIDFPDNSTWGWGGVTRVSNVNWVEDVIQDIALKTRNRSKVYVDYFKVWKEGIKVTSAETTVDLRNINVKLTSNDTLDMEIAEYIKLYEADGITEVTGLTKNYDAAEKIITFTSETDLPAGNIYKVKIDKAALLADMKYIWEADEEITVEAPACAVVNLAIKGVLAPGTELEADYDLMPEGSVEGASVFTWYTVDEQGNTTIIGGQTGKTFTVTNDYIDSTITYSVAPKCVVEGVEKTGIETKCQVNVTPLSKPVASNLAFDKSGAMIDFDLTALYDYSDADGDEEINSVVNWYAGSDADFVISGEPFATGTTIKVPAELTGKFIKFTITPVNNALFRAEGDTVSSAGIGPVADMITASNLFVNSGLESGEIAPFSASVREGYRGITIVDKTTNPNGVYEGNYGLRIHPRVSLSDSFGQYVPIEANKAYIVSAMLKSANSDGSWSGWEGYDGSPAGDGNAYRPFRDAQQTALTNDNWVRVSTTFVTGVGGSWKVGMINWGNWSSAEAYADNLYIGELMISDIKTKTLAPVTIPLENEDSIRLDILDTDSDGKVIICNQFGERDGLEGQTVKIRIPDGLAGVEVKNNKLVINSNAIAGKFNIDIVCIPDFSCTETTSTGKTINYTPTPAQSEFVKTVELELLPNSNTAPQARNVDARGTVYTGSTLMGSYDFYQIDGDADASEIQWVYADTPDGKFKPIPGATSLNYVVTSAYADKVIKFSVTPKTATDDGVTVYSGMLVQATAPEARNIMVSGDYKIDGTLNGAYDYYDANRDEEGATTLKWYVADAATGEWTAIPGAESPSLVLTSDLTDKFIKFGVTPKAVVAPYIGAETFSEVFRGPVAPEARDVSVKVEGNRLTGIYTYYHEHGARELKSIYKWTVDGNVVSTEASFVANFSGVKTVTFTVTPVGDTTPGTGKSVSVSAVINGTSGNPGGNTPAGGFVGGGSSSGGGFGGSSGGSGGGSSSSGGQIASGIISINDVNLDTEENKEEQEKTPASDLDGHWGEEYIKVMEERGVMSADEDGKYNPDELVTREDMLTFLFKTLKLEKTEYSGMFGDVTDADFGGILQTMVDNGTISKDTTFRPGDSISREEMCKILYISLKNAGKLENVDEGLINGLSDYNDISDWAVKYVNEMYGIKMMIGVSDTRFAPQENVTKAQAATMLTRIISWVEEE